MIEFRPNGNIFDDEGIILVPVNTRGVMGAGLALAFKKRYLDFFHRYKAMCDQNKFKPGMVMRCHIGDDEHIFVSTKDHWKDPSQIHWIESIMRKLPVALEGLSDSKPILIPKLGCGLGGLNWEDVRRVILDELRESGLDKSRHVVIYGEPE